ncbi:MAG: hypothetical protein JXQ72_11645 [Anaerolineae bacterium]|nr:hypothetical protein [Anaerolineae bacterium]
MAEEKEQIAEVRNATVLNLRSVLHTSALRELSELSLPEMEIIIERVGQVVPAGNVPAMILSGLARVSERKAAPDTVRRDINALFKGVEQALDRVVFSAFFAGPAAILWGYQNLLSLVGKDVESAFPEGTWQFYVDYALREDTARHANETHGFDTLLTRYQISLTPVDRMTAWIMACIHSLHQYNDLLENEWRERVAISLLRDVAQNEADTARYARLYREWELQRPYSRDHDSAAWETYPAYRRRHFDQFLSSAAESLPGGARRKWQAQLQAAEGQSLPAYQRQMTILSYLEPSEYRETRVPLPLDQAHVGLIYQGRYHLFPACAPDTDRPADVAMIRGQVAAALANTSPEPVDGLESLADVQRGALAGLLRNKLDSTLVTEIKRLRLAPILLNVDSHPRTVPLADLRKAERGVGSHALTIFDTGETFVFDQSHIYFDGAWGAAFAEILTNEAVAWAVYLQSLPPAQPVARPYTLKLQFKPADTKRIKQVPRTPPEVCVESDLVNIRAIQMLRSLLKRRSDMLRLTVNDLLVLYRAIHAVQYRPSNELTAELNRHARKKANRPALDSVQLALNPAAWVQAAILVPMDASRRAPSQRIHPVSFEVPLDELDLLVLHRQTVDALEAFKAAPRNRAALYREFADLQRRYLAALAGFGEFSNRIKELAIEGKSASVGTLKLLAHVPPPIRRMLEQIPERFDMLNDLIRGREVFSNVGAVVPSSTLVRFITAKDDNEKKTLCWGVLTDAAGIMRMSLRDFRPHVGLLEQAGLHDLAVLVAQDYLDAYVQGLNVYVSDLQRIALGTREAQDGR